MTRLHVYLRVSCWLVMAGSAMGQATVEYGLNAGRAATTAVPGKSVGKAMSGLADSLDKAVKGQPGSAAQPTPGTAAKPAAKVAASTAKTAAPAIDTAPPPAPNW